MKSIVSVIIFCISTIASYSQANKHLLPLSTLLKSTEVTERYLKLGNTYREAKQFDIALIYLNKGLTLAQNSNNKYWTAVAYEYKGYLYRDSGDLLSAREYLEKAKIIFERIIKMEKGSNEAIDMVIQELNKKTVILDNSKSMITPLEVTRMKQDIDGYKLRISNLEKENAELKQKKLISNESKSSRTSITPERKELGTENSTNEFTPTNKDSIGNKDRADDSILNIGSEKLPQRGPNNIEVESDQIKENIIKQVDKPKRPILPKPISIPK